jgi:hypothetical protein
MDSGEEAAAHRLPADARLVEARENYSAGSATRSRS